MPNNEELIPNTNYTISLISSFDGVEFRSERAFSTRDISVVNNDIAFYSQGIIPNSSNQENYLNQDLPIRFKVKVKNELTQSLSTLTGTISSTTTGVTITDNSVSFGNLSSGASIWSNDEFEIEVDASVLDGTLLEFELSTDDQVVSGGPWVSSFSFPMAPLVNGEIILVENGNNDGTPEPGEHLQLFPKINNISNNTIAKVYGTLSSDDAFLSFTSDFQKYNWLANIHEPIEPSDTDILPEFAFELDYPSNEPLQELNFNLELQGNLNDNDGPLLKWITSFLYNEGIEAPPIIVATSPTDNATDIAIETALEITFDKNVTAVTGKNIYIYNNGSLETTYETTAPQVSVNNETVTIDPTDELQGGANYYIIIDIGAFIDISSNEFAGIDNPVTWNFTTLQSNPPEAPQNVIATALSDSEIELNWDLVADADTYKVLSCDESIVYETATSSITLLVSGLQESTFYDFIVKAENTVGLSDSSNCANATTFCNHPWGDVQYQGGNNTTAYGIVTIDGSPASENDKVGAFVGDELRGIGNVVLSSGIAYTTISIEGASVETVGFRVWDQSECQEVLVVYTTDTNPGNEIGLPPNYLPIGADSSIGIASYELSSKIKIFPNPTKNSFRIDTQEQIITVEIYTILGEKVKTYDKMENYSIQDLANGVYLVTIKTDKGVGFKKVIKE